MGELTKAGRAVLAAMPDWSAPYEIRDRIGGTIRLAERIARSHARSGLADYSPANNTYRQSEAGRQALHQEGGRE